MHFEERHIPSHAEPIVSLELKEGSVYFFVEYFDDDLLVPNMEAVVFAGRNLELGESERVYFQDINSYRKGIRYGESAEREGAIFFMGQESEVGHVFHFEKALEELMRCSLKRRKRGIASTTIPRAQQGFVSGEKSPESAEEERYPRSLRFEDPALQASLIDGLRDTAVPFEIREDGGIVFKAADWPAVNTVAHKIRDRCFRWYFSWWKDISAAHRFWEEMNASGLPFQVEYHDDRIVFVLPKRSEDLHQTVAMRIVELVPDSGERSGPP